MMPKAAVSFAVLTLGAMGMTTILALMPVTGHDQLWLLLAAQRMLASHSLNPYGPTVFESNPPLAIWLSALVVSLAKSLGASLTVTFKVAMSLLAAVVAWVCGRLLHRLRPQLTRANGCFLLFAFVLIFGAVPARDFGQRDFVLTLLVLPYLIGAALQIDGRPLPGMARVAITLCAALGIALKPHQALIPIAVETTLLAYPRLLRTLADAPRHNAMPGEMLETNLGSGPAIPRWPRVLEPALFLLAGLGYYVVIRVLAPTYLTVIVPALKETYWGFGGLDMLQLQSKSIALNVLASISLGCFALRLLLLPAALRPLVPVLLAGGTAALVAYIAQGTGWYYQQLPAISLFSLALALQLIDLSGRKTVTLPGWLPWAAGGLTVVSLTLTAWASHFERTPQGLRQLQPRPAPSLFAGLAPGTAVATLTTSVDDTIEPAFLYDLTLAQRYPHLWMLPAILRNESGPRPQRVIPPERLAQLTAMQRQFMVEDLTRWRPKLILVERCQDPAMHCQALEDRHDDLLAFFLADPAFRAIFGQYRFVRSAGMYDAYARAEN